ncbi:MAG: phosphoribosyl-ATP pyrophosphatase [Hadesarchaea archaeon YNP_N21]|jgi:phosphoribosyl-ATP pyrophosphohydrolase|nr:MAG: phosphoribosyl-ATP pyrophosphatase [Hadesarchaea archaeon YNP_N21]
MGTEILDEVFAVIEDRRDNPKEGSYVSKLLSHGTIKAMEKVSEEAQEFIEASKGDERHEIIHEAADVIFHVMVLLAAKGIKLNEVMDELKRRRR